MSDPVCVQVNAYDRDNILCGYAYLHRGHWEVLARQWSAGGWEFYGRYPDQAAAEAQLLRLPGYRYLSRIGVTQGGAA